MCAATPDSLLAFFYIIIITYIKVAVLFIFLVAVIIRNEDVVFVIHIGSSLLVVHALMVSRFLFHFLPRFAARSTDFVAIMPRKINNECGNGAYKA